jgi:hypothetical protein
MSRFQTAVAFHACLFLAGGVIAAASQKSSGQNSNSPVRPASSAKRNAPAEKTAKIVFEGSVLAVTRGHFPDAALTLDLTKSSDLKTWGSHGDPHDLKVIAAARKSPGRVLSFSDAKAVNLAGAYYLQPGDRLRGVLLYVNNAWHLDYMERLPTALPTAPKVASLRVELSTDRDSYSLGDDVRLNLAISNRGTAPALFRFPTGQKYDFALRQNGREVWRWSQGKSFSASANALSLKPGETLSFHETWPGIDHQGLPVEPGRYTVAGWLTATGQSSITESTSEIDVQDAQGPYVDDLIASPRSYVNKEITLEGLYRAHLAERGEPLVQNGPPTSRSDWILQDTTGSIYVAGTGGNLFNDSDINKRVRVKGLLRRTPEGALYLRAWEVQKLPNRNE